MFITGKPGGFNFLNTPVHELNLSNLKRLCPSVPANKSVVSVFTP